MNEIAALVRRPGNSVKFIGNGAKFTRPLLVTESARKPGLNYDGSKANDLKFGEYTKEQIKNIRGMFEVDDILRDLDKVSASTLFTIFENMATELFSTGKMQCNIMKMIEKFKSNTGGTYSDFRLTNAAKKHEKTKTFEAELVKKMRETIKKYKGDIFKIISRQDIKLQSRIYFNTWWDIFGGLTIATNDIWAYKIEITNYEFDGINYHGKYRITLYDHFGLDEPDVDNSKEYGYLAGFRAWFILQHLDRFAYKPFMTVIVLENEFSGSIK